MNYQEKVSQIVESKKDFDVKHDIITVKSVTSIVRNPDCCNKRVDTLHEGEFYTNSKFYSVTRTGLQKGKTYNIFYFTSEVGKKVILDIVNVNDSQSLNKCCMLNTRYRSVNGVGWKPKSDGTFIRVEME